MMMKTTILRSQFSCIPRQSNTRLRPSHLRSCISHSKRTISSNRRTFQVPESSQLVSKFRNLLSDTNLLNLRHPSPLSPPPPPPSTTTGYLEHGNAPKNSTLLSEEEYQEQEESTSKWWVPTLTGGGVSLLGMTVVLLLIAGMADDSQRALAFGPEGPLLEEFWENMRRYGLYAITVGSGVLYSVFQPIFELLKNPISGILVIIIIGGTIFIISQVLSAMVGVSEFNYEYGY